MHEASVNRVEVIAIELGGVHKGKYNKIQYKL